MNCVFQDYKIRKGFFIFVKPNHHLGEQDIHYKVMNNLTKAMGQYGEIKFAMNCNYIQWSQVNSHFCINPCCGLSGPNQNIKRMSLAKDNNIDTSLARDNLKFACKESFNVSAQPTTMITKNTTNKLDDTSAAGKLKIENKNQNKAQKQDNEEVKTTRNNSEAIDFDFCYQDFRKNVREKKTRSSGYNRWGRQKDVQLFQTLQKICSEQNINIEDFLNNNVVMTKNHQMLLEGLKYQVQWKRRTSAMLKRIKMLAKDQSLSVRQCIVLRKLVAKARRSKTNLVVEDIAYMFPGKLISTLQSWLDDFKNNKQ